MSAAALRFKIDENLPLEAAGLLRAAGYETHSVYDEALAGASDPQVAAACAVEARVLVTLDLDVSDVRAYPPGTHPGIIVLRPRVPDRDSTLTLLARAVPLLATEAVRGCVWIVDAERVRVRAPREAS